MKKYVESPDYYELTVKKLARLRGVLGGKNPSGEVALAIETIVNRKRLHESTVVGRGHANR